jgi:hypothetical protein
MKWSRAFEVGLPPHLLKGATIDFLPSAAVYEKALSGIEYLRTSSLRK